MELINNVILKYPVCPFRPTYLTLSRGSVLLSAVNQGNTIMVYAHTFDCRVEDPTTRMAGVELAYNDKNWEVWEIRVYRAGMRTNVPKDAKSLGTVILREGKCFNHVYAIKVGVPSRNRTEQRIVK
jgi:NhaP-type Na+/H+ and K+/H+ antiporter